MSYLIPPRLSFLGNSYANASTANNNDLAAVYDIDTMRLNGQMTLYPGASAIDPPPPAGNVFRWNSAADNPELRQWLMGLMLAEGFGEDGGHGQMAHWNYYGDHNTEFQNTKVVGAVRANGQPAADSDPVFRLGVELLGDVFYGTRRGAVLVDADPYALVTSQIFAGQFRLGYPIPGGKTAPVLIADHPTPAYSYFINPYKNLNPDCEGFEAVSAVFQFALQKENLTFVDDPQFQSPALRDLQQRAQSGQGLLVRFCFYDAIFRIQATELHQKFKQGEYVFNPYVGKVLGTIGVWNRDELGTAPLGRKLRVQTPYTYTPPEKYLPPAVQSTRRKILSTVSKYRGRHTTDPVPATPPKSASLGVALAQVDTQRQVIALDCISTFPEAHPETRDKFNLGPLNLVLQYGANESQTVTVGPIPNTRRLYESQGGIVEVSYAGSQDRETIAAQIATGRLTIQRAEPAGPLLQEDSGIDVQTDNRVVYFDAQIKQIDGQTVPGTSVITIQVSSKGVPPTTATKVNLEYWMCEKDNVNPDKPQVPVPLDRPYFQVSSPEGPVVPLSPTEYTLGFLAHDPDYPGGKVQVKTDQVIVPPGGRLKLTLQALRPGVSMLRFADPAELTPPNFAWDNVDFSVVRILPFDDYSHLSDQQINDWKFMYEEVFGFYSVMYPVMSKVIPWGPTGAPNNPEEVKQFASVLLAFTDPEAWSSTIYMPISRDLSDGKRQLIRRWCNLQQ